MKAIGTAKEDFEMFDKDKNKKAKKVVTASQKEARGIWFLLSSFTNNKISTVVNNNNLFFRIISND